MIVAAVDVSISIKRNLKTYSDEVSKVLASLKFPIRHITWSNRVVENRMIEKFDRELFNYKPADGTIANCFLKILPKNKPIDLYVFTDGEIGESDVEECQDILKNNKSVQISQVNLFYIGKESAMNLGFTDVFTGIPQKIHINENYVGQVEAVLPNFDDITYEYIMKDDSFKATILNCINCSKVDQAKLKSEISKLECRILKKYFEDRTSIYDYYVKKDVQGCISYVKDNSSYKSKSELQSKISSILNLFSKNVDTYSLSNFQTATKYTLNCPDQNNCSNQNNCSDQESCSEEENCTEDQENCTEKNQKTYTEEDQENLECEYLPCDILYTTCKIGCIPIKQCNDAVWPDKKILQNPFKILESEELVQRIVGMVEPYTMDYQKTYKNLTNPSISPFTRDELKGVFVLHADGIDVQALIKHNNYVLSTFFQNKLPGKAVLWHVIFLYILAMRRFQEYKDIFFSEIRYLGEHAEYFITLNPYLNPPIVENLNCCFWYIAKVCPKAFPNSAKNVLRKEFISGDLLDFYQNVYETDYEWPQEMYLWQLWYHLSRKTLNIFKILSFYFDHEEVETTRCKYSLILYREEKKSEIPEEFKFLSNLDLETILNVYIQYKNIRGSDYFKNLNMTKKLKYSFYEDIDDDSNLLDHIEINPSTCHPYVICKVTGKHWRDCIGPFNTIRYSYIRLFKRYCEKYQEYPKKPEDLCAFLNEFVFKHKRRFPELFPRSLKQEMNTVMEIFGKIMTLYSWEEYLKISNKMSSEKIRVKKEICE